MPSGWRLTSEGSSVSQAGLEGVARELIDHSENRKIWLFFGEMGGGLPDYFLNPKLAAQQPDLFKVATDTAAIAPDFFSKNEV